MSRNILEREGIAPLVNIKGTRKERREKITAFEEALKTLPQAECRTVLKHAFLDGAYFRQISIPAGIALTGKIHSCHTINMLTKGRFAIVTEWGEQVIDAPYMYISDPGTKKACYTITDCIFINCHTTWETDLEKIEAAVTADEYAESLEETTAAEEATEEEESRHVLVGSGCNRGQQCD